MVRNTKLGNGGHTLAFPKMFGTLCNTYKNCDDLQKSEPHTENWNYGNIQN